MELTRLFIGDYSTSAAGQWPSVQNINYNSTGAGYSNTQYPFRVTVLDGDCGYCARFEVRNGDIPPGMPSGARSEVGEAPATSTLAPTETVRWYAFSVRFDPTFPNNHASLGWGVTNQWQDNFVATPTISLGFQSATPDGYFSLSQDPQSSPNVYLGKVRLLDIPLNPGNWIDMKMEVKWSGLDANGYINFWVNGVRQTFLPGAGGGQTFTGRTAIPSATYVHYHEGYYRQDPIASTGIIYHTGFRIADSAASL